MSAVFLNGQFVSLDDARISVLDAGIQHGVGLFETMLGGASNDHPWAMLLDEHMDRLATSARDLGLSTAMRTAALGDAVLETVRRAALPRCRVRVTITAGSIDATAARPPRAPTEPRDATILITATPAPDYPAPMFDRGVAATIADARANPFNPTEGHKTLNYWWRLRELADAGRKGAAEALIFSVTNHLAGGCVSNAFIVRNNEVLTPIARGEEGRDTSTKPSTPADAQSFLYDKPSPKSAGGAYLPSPVLPGIARAWAMHTLAADGRAVQRRMITITDLLDADEVFLTNSLWGVLPVVKIEAKAIGTGEVGPVARSLIAAWRAEIESASA